MKDSHTTTNQSKTRAGQQSRTKVAGGLLTAVTAALLALTGCTPAPTGPNTAGPSISSTANPETRAPTTEAAPPTVPEAVYEPASAEGPAQNVPVPVLPEAAKEFSKEGLIAFAEYWYETLGYAFETGDPEPMMAISQPGCRTCEAIQNMVLAGHADGKWIMGGKMVIGTPDTSFVSSPDGTYQAITMARQEQVQYFNADKTLSKDLGVTVAEGDILVGVRADDRWVAVTVEHLAGS
ncbi:DUF6318 family protein [Specibacter sp. AOP5-B1-6]|uniref:DUF6318 family protein n=1 Tax=Specibacter sp. AOP5-B1-6 TaxID=3457653 RepID=UPI00402B85C8